ncbi:hypothetical protein [Sulfuricurvum sp.]|uniref:hypothetical protein n=1 Tax=Sulfuricurvum sp. TaxID=2025608 RepID=UPI00260C0175|nr:hypothetical protein [Sulfuricurvum sp.]MDD3595590.1 hypothetical protein [Sulfuricurvum sp.]
MRFTNIQAFENRMLNANVNVAFFTLQYHNCAIEIAYSSVQRKFLFAFVDHNVGFTCSLNGEYANGYINHQEAVVQLMNCRNHNRYNPIHFYEFLNNQLPHANFVQVSRNQYDRTVQQAVSNFEDRIYFNHWRNSNMSPKQRNKTIELMGHNVVEFCDQNHIIPVFFPYPTERTLTTFEDFQQDYNEHGLGE